MGGIDPGRPGGKQIITLNVWISNMRDRSINLYATAAARSAALKGFFEYGRTVLSI